ncbi:RNA-binding S4 domain-containing protein [Echinimonas agarilytica]|uniref:Heat shock protein 15 n=1 Tax=Echinimonas agarilytica TaxID=1215918 RepID=A0AA41W8Z2_9GAMM|nr:S4 domain-containing protein [Echinimonas agarilytica]MCM2680896.1 S4 domain-containing protein [Echinimonas agarilytica]
MTESSKVRLDKWLCAARFYKTRALARQMVEGGKVRYNDQRSKPSRSVDIGALIRITIGQIEKTVEVKGLSEVRRSAPEAQLLYQETPESEEKRARLKTQHQLAYQTRLAPEHKPDKKQRRTLLGLKAKQL